MFGVRTDYKWSAECDNCHACVTCSVTSLSLAGSFGARASLWPFDARAAWIATGFETRSIVYYACILNWPVSPCQHDGVFLPLFQTTGLETVKAVCCRDRRLNARCVWRDQQTLQGKPWVEIMPGLGVYKVKCSEGGWPVSIVRLWRLQGSS